MVRTTPVKEFDLVIGGFRQSPYEATGVDALANELRPLNSRDRAVEALGWNEDWRTIARWIRRIGVKRPAVRVYSYSWGVGWGTTQLARQLRRLDIEIAHVVASDGVYRSRLLPAWLPLNVVSMLSYPEIEMPANVRRVDWFYQRVTSPGGHRIVAEDPEQTIISRGVERKPENGHLGMDEDLAWRLRCLNVASPERIGGAVC